MIVSIIVLSLFSVLLITGLVLSLKYNILAGRQLREYDEFFQNTVEDIEESMIYLEKLTKKELISEDPDVKNFQKLLYTTKDILGGYLYAGKNKEK